jgi:hypothetical protein
MSEILYCDNSASDLRAELYDHQPTVSLRFVDEAEGRIWSVEAPVRAVHAQDDGSDRAVFVMPRVNRFISVILAADADTVEVVDPDYVRLLLDELFERTGAPDPIALAVEEYLRWYLHRHTVPMPSPADAGPFSEHPELRNLPLTIREQIDRRLVVGGPLAVDCAARALRTARPDITTAHATTVIEALRIDLC